MLRQETPVIRPGVKGWAAALSRPRLLWRVQNTVTHPDIRQWMSPHTEWLTVCSHTQVFPQDNTGLHTHTHTETCDIQVLSLLSNTPTLSVSHKHRITQCVALHWRHHASIVQRPEKEQGVRSSPGEGGSCERRKRREGGRDDRWLRWVNELLIRPSRDCATHPSVFFLPHQQTATQHPLTGWKCRSPRQTPELMGITSPTCRNVFSPWLICTIRWY